MKLFNNPITVAGTPREEESLLENSLFFELIVFLCLRIGALALSSGLKMGNALAHLLGTLRRIFGFFLGLYFWFYAFTFYQYMNELRKIEKANPGQVTDRGKFNVWLSWIISGYVIIEVIWAIVEVAMAAAGNPQTT